MSLKDVRTICFPYCVKLANEKQIIFLNREYKPIGFNTGEIVEYENHPISHKIKESSKKILEQISVNYNEKDKLYFLYDDSCIPTKSKKNMDEYLERFSKLAKIEISN